MSWLRVLASRLRGLVRRSRLEQDLEEEIRFHLAMQAEENLRAGMNPATAHSAARLSFGPVEAVKEEYRERLSFSTLDSFAQDLGYALRTLRKNPGFTAASIATLAVTIGANAAVLSVLGSVLLRPLPYRDPGQLVMLWTESPSENLREGRSGYWNVEAWRRARSFTGLAAFDGVSVTLAAAGRAERVTSARITPDFFSLLGVSPLAGRMFSSDEAQQRQRVVLISHSFWQSHFAGAPAAIGSSVELDGTRSEVIGILPPDFHFPRLDAQLWEPHTLFPDWDVRSAVRGVDTWSVVGRLRPRVTPEQAQTEMDALARRLDDELPPSERQRGITVVPLSLHIVGPGARFALWILAGAVFCILLIAASNVASLSLARGISRAREFFVRAALGASASRIIRQLLVESLTLAVLAGVAGASLAWVAVRFLQSIDPGILGLSPRFGGIEFNWPALGVVLAISLFVGLLVGLAPASLIRRQSRELAAESGRGVTGGGAARRLRQALVAGQFALAIVLLFAAGLLIRSWYFAERADAGFLPERVLTMELRTPAQMPASQRAAFYHRVLQEVAALPGVEKAGFASDLFITSTREQVLSAEGASRDHSIRIALRRDEVSPDFFLTLGTPLRAGRHFSPADSPGAPPAAIISQSLAHRLWPNADPVGRRFKFGPAGDPAPWFTVVGVVADMRRQGMDREPVPQIFESINQNPSASGTLVVRSLAPDPLLLTPAIQASVRRIDRHAPLSTAEALDARLSASLMPRRFQSTLMALFSAIALLLAVVGINGLIHFSVAARRREIGIRMAVGACRGDIFRMILGEGLRLSLAGLALGLLAAIPVGRLLNSLLFGVSPADPHALLAGSALLLGLSLLACWFPARLAMRIEPVSALATQ